jgi:CheY-like chemotaxis protein
VPRVLVIEDEAVVRSVIRRILLEGGHEVIEADTTRSGLEAACSVEADVVLGDLCLGVEDGIGAMAAIRRARPEIPLIAVSGSPLEEIRDQLNAAGLQQSVWCLAKPFCPESLIGVVRQALTPPA